MDLMLNDTSIPPKIFYDLNLESLSRALKVLKICRYASLRLGDNIPVSSEVTGFYSQPVTYSNTEYVTLLG
jgi:hypothetical protein